MTPLLILLFGTHPVSSSAAGWQYAFPIGCCDWLSPSFCSSLSVGW
jgi:hypothetical protein